MNNIKSMKRIKKAYDYIVTMIVQKGEKGSKGNKRKLKARNIEILTEKDIHYRYYAGVAQW